MSSPRKTTHVEARKLVALDPDSAGVLVEVNERDARARTLVGFGDASLCKALKLKPGTLRQHVARGQLDPSDLGSVVDLAISLRAARGRGGE